MKISEYVAKLEEIERTEGDLEVMSDSAMGYRIVALGPRIAYELVLQGRESVPRFWAEYCVVSRRGKKVVRI